MARMAIGIDASWFEHLLNCMANQKFIGELPQDEREEAQSVIDEAWLDGMEVLHSDGHAVVYPSWPHGVSIAGSMEELRTRFMKPERLAGKPSNDTDN